MVLADLHNMLPPMVKAYLFTLIIPVILAAFFWMCVGVLDRECTKADKSKSVEFTRNAHIFMGLLTTLIAAGTVSKLVFGKYQAGAFKNMSMPNFRR